MHDQELVAITISQGTRRWKKHGIMERYGHLNEKGMRFTTGGEEDLIRRLRTLLLMARRAVIDLMCEV